MAVWSRNQEQMSACGCDYTALQKQTEDGHAHLLIQGCVAKAAVKYRAWGSRSFIGSSATHEVGDNPTVIWVTARLLICSHAVCCMLLGAVLVQQDGTTSSRIGKDSQ